MNKVTDYIRNPAMILAHFIRGKAKWMPDEMYLKILFRANLGYSLNLNHPKTFNEKLQWIKLYDRRDEYVQMVDKVSAKEYVAPIIGRQHIIQTLGVWEKFDDIDFDALPDRFVLKCTHDSHTVVICKDKKHLDMAKARATIEHGLKTNYYLVGREWPYKNVKPRILAEEYIAVDGMELYDYKIYCFNGVPKLVCVASGRGVKGGLRIDYYDLNKERLPIQSGTYKNSTETHRFPDEFEDMVTIAAKLSRGIPYVRVDLYCVQGTIYFGELTLFDSAGFVPLHPSQWDEVWGSWIQLPPRKT